MQTVVETAAYLRRAEMLLDETEREAVADIVAANPEAGVLMEGTGGIRKLQVALHGRGKSGGARVIYYYHSENVPIFLFGIFA
jgi:mRNA-degrading endonuclease RelE of RelBE toxin-antitoxin system